MILISRKKVCKMYVYSLYNCCYLQLDRRNAYCHGDKKLIKMNFFKIVKNIPKLDCGKVMIFLYHNK